MMRSRAFIPFALLLIAVAAFATAPKRHARRTTKSVAVAHKTYSVAMSAMQFQPPALNVNVGDTIVWTNKDLVPHSATKAGAFDSTAVAPGKSWKYTARTKGDLAYACVFHPTMKAVLHVK